MDRVLRAMKTADVTVDELERERRRLVTSEMASSSTLAGENDVVAGLVIQQLPPDDVPSDRRVSSPSAPTTYGASGHGTWTRIG